jgi:alkanesulfonate monooxygenase SsuD/methylene tetrahydromethanopterin reductase-like flavin-dependent oxidoreductase (luciferase family)
MRYGFKAPLYDAEGGRGGTVGAERRPFSGSPAEVARDIATYARLGVSQLIFDFRSESLAESLERMERFATEIMAPALATP